ncbi:hypothetical protein ACS77_02100 [Pseudomonas syringae]|uniref:Serine protease n=1 Tax=Pseudomonas syringae TaxID=317 RepID=A0A0L1MLY3_PSESX|nr:hypothetical protein ACS77_02100 [Pseudomonas syringae]
MADSPTQIDVPNTPSPDSLEREKWEAEKAFREREVVIKERQLIADETELELKRTELASSSWRNPLVVAIMAATVAATGNAVVSVLNGFSQRNLEEQKSEQARILEMIKTGSADKAAENLKFLLEAGLIADSVRAGKIREFLSKREPGEGPTLPTGASQSGTIGPDDAVELRALPTGTALANSSRSVGRLVVQTKSGAEHQCTAFLVDGDLVLTAGFCLVEDVTVAHLIMPDGDTEASYPVQVTPIERPAPMGAPTIFLLRVDGQPGTKHGFLKLASTPPSLGQQLNLVMFRGGSQAFAVAGAPKCRVQKLLDNEFVHQCSTGAGSSGSPILSADGSTVIGIHTRREEAGSIAVRADVLHLVTPLGKGGK